MTPDTPTPPLGAGDLLGNAGPLPAAVIGGESYALSVPGPPTLALIEQRLLDSAYEEVDAATGRATSDAARRRLERRTAELDACYFDRGEHKVGRPKWEEAFNSPRGVVLLVWACVAQTRPAFTEADAERLAAIDPKGWARAVARVMAPFAHAYARRLGADPARAEAAIRERLPAVEAAVAELDRPPT